MTVATGYQSERIDHVGIVAGVCREIGLAAYLDALDEHVHERVGVGTATVAMVLNGLGCSTRRLYLVPQFFANTPVAHLLGAGLTAEDLTDECLGRTLDWLSAHDPTALFAGIAYQARCVFGVQARHVHVDTTSFAVSGHYEPEEGDLDAQAIAMTSGSSRDHREDLKQWMLALATTQDGEIPVFLRALDGNASDNVRLAEAVTTLLHVAGPDAGRRGNRRGGARALCRRQRALQRSEYDSIQSGGHSLDQPGARNLDRGQGRRCRRCSGRTDELAGHRRRRRPVAQSSPGLAARGRALAGRADASGRGTGTRQRRASASRVGVARRVAEQQETWQRRLWHLSNQEFACQADAEAALTRALRGQPEWLQVTSQIQAQPRFARLGRPRKDAAPTAVVWRVLTELHVQQEQVEQRIVRTACFLVGTNVLDPAEVADEEAIRMYTQDQGGIEREIERGFAFLKDPLFLASSVFLKKPTRIVALSLIMVLCLLIYRLAEHRLRQQLALTGQTVPNHLHQPTQRPTMRWIFHCFEGLDRLTVQTAAGPQVLMLHLTPVHGQVLTLLGPAYREM